MVVNKILELIEEAEMSVPPSYYRTSSKLQSGVRIGGVAGGATILTFRDNNLDSSPIFKSDYQALNFGGSTAVGVGLGAIVGVVTSLLAREDQLKRKLNRMNENIKVLESVGNKEGVKKVKEDKEKFLNNLKSQYYNSYKLIKTEKDKKTMDQLKYSLNQIQPGLIK